ncbi:MAG: hypothetical protein WAW80_03745 [Candidatus Saccharimonadales bacterium]
MRKIKEQSRVENERGRSRHIIYPQEPLLSIPEPTLPGRLSAKIEIIITHQQLQLATRLFLEAGKRKPGWLRQRFYINQRRRKLLNSELLEAGLDGDYCGSSQRSFEWDWQLHTLWHAINGTSPCK